MELILPDKKYYPSYLEAIREYREHGVHTHPFVDVDRYDVFEHFEDFRTGKNLPQGYVKATYLWLVDGDEFIGGKLNPPQPDGRSFALWRSHRLWRALYPMEKGIWNAHAL